MSQPIDQWRERMARIVSGTKLIHQVGPLQRGIYLVGALNRLPLTYETESGPEHGVGVVRLLLVH